MNKTEIRVTIDSVEKQQKAIEILGRYGEPIWEDKYSMNFLAVFDSLRMLHDEWYISRPLEYQTEITLDQLEEILKNEKK